MRANRIFKSARGSRYLSRAKIPKCSGSGDLLAWFLRSVSGRFVCQQAVGAEWLGFGIDWKTHCQVWRALTHAEMSFLEEPIWGNKKKNDNY